MLPDLCCEVSLFLLLEQGPLRQFCLVTFEALRGDW
jgi:hypothetical protein